MGSLGRACASLGIVALLVPEPRIVAAHETALRADCGADSPVAPNVGYIARIVPAARIAAEPSPTFAPGEELAMCKLAILLLAQLQTGELDRSLLDPGLSRTLTPAVLAVMVNQLRPLGKPNRIEFDAFILPGAYRTFRYRLEWETFTILETFAIEAGGKIAALQFKQVF